MIKINWEHLFPEITDTNYQKFFEAAAEALLEENSGITLNVILTKGTMAHALISQAAQQGVRVLQESQAIFERIINGR